MNKSGIVFLYRLMLGITIIILGIALASPTKTVIDEVMTDFSCSAPASDFVQAACIGVDIIKFMFVGGVIFIGFLIMTKLR